MHGIGKTLGAIAGILAGILAIMIIGTGVGSAQSSEETFEAAFMGLEIGGGILGFLVAVLYTYLSGFATFGSFSLAAERFGKVKEVFVSRRKETEQTKYRYVRGNFYCEKAEGADGAPYRELYGNTLRRFEFATEENAAKAISKMKEGRSNSWKAQKRVYLFRNQKIAAALRGPTRFVGNLFLGIGEIFLAILVVLAPVFVFSGLACAIPLYIVDCGLYWLIPFFAIVIGAVVMIVTAILNDWYD